MTDNMCQAVPEKASIIDLFPEFVDDDRKKIIEELIKQNDPELRRVSRACSFFVWLADFSCLEKLKAMPPEERKESLQKMEILKNFNLPDAFKSDECSQGLLDRGALVRRLSQVAKEVSFSLLESNFFFMVADSKCRLWPAMTTVVLSPRFHYV